MSAEIQELALSIADLTTDSAEAVIRLQKLVVLVQIETQIFNNERIARLEKELKDLKNQHDPVIPWWKFWRS